MIEEFDEQRIRNKRERDMEKLRRQGLQRRQAREAKEPLVLPKIHHRPNTSSSNPQTVKSRAISTRNTSKVFTRNPSNVSTSSATTTSTRPTGTKVRPRSRSAGSSTNARRTKVNSSGKSREDMDREYAELLQRQFDMEQADIQTPSATFTTSQALPLHMIQLVNRPMTPRTFDELQIVLAITASIREENRSMQISPPLGNSNSEDLSYESLLELEDVKVGLSERDMMARTSLVNAPALSSSGDKQSSEECSICLCELFDEDSQPVRRIRVCGHEYHEGCLFHWLKASKKCPLCKEEV